MIEPLEVHELVNDDVVANPWRHHDQPPVQADVPVAAAGSPARPLISNADPPDGEAKLCGKLVQAGRQLDLGLRLPRPSVEGQGRLASQPLALPRDPLGMPPRERVGLAARAAARNRHADAPIVIDPQKVAPGAAVADEIDLCDSRFAYRCRGCDCGLARRCKRGCGCWCRIGERKTQLHDHRIPESAATAGSPATDEQLS